jgi:prevent-host-death family protein
MKTWPVQDAKARFSELIETCLREGPQLVTRRGLETVVLVPAAQWRRLVAPKKPTPKEWLLSDRGRTDRLVPLRGRLRRRVPSPI